MRTNTEAALRLLVEQGAHVEEVSISFDREGIQQATLKELLSSAMGSMLLGVTQAGRPDDLTGYARYFAGLAQSMGGPVQLTEGQAYAARMHAEYDALFERGFDAFACPTLATGHVPAAYDFQTDSLSVDGQEVDPLSGWILTPAFNLIYTVPVVNVPTGLDVNGVPTGMQLAARAYDDLAAFRVAAAYSEAAPAFFTDGVLPDFRGRES